MTKQVSNTSQTRTTLEQAPERASSRDSVVRKFSSASGSVINRRLKNEAPQTDEGKLEMPLEQQQMFTVTMQLEMKRVRSERSVTRRNGKRRVWSACSVFVRLEEEEKSVFVAVGFCRGLCCSVVGVSLRGVSCLIICFWLTSAYRLQPWVRFF